jgi:hypothetical protein
MFHWICPECGREIAPTVRECPACDPKAVVAEPALVGVVEAPARALNNVEAPTRALNVEAPAPGLGDHVDAPPHALSLEVLPRAVNGALARFRPPEFMAVEAPAPVVPDDSDELPQLAPSPFAGSDSLGELAMVIGLLDDATPDPAMAAKIPLSLWGAPSAPKARIPESTPAPGTRHPALPLPASGRTTLERQPPLLETRAELRLPESRPPVPPAPATVTALGPSRATLAAPRRTPYPGAAPALAPLVHYSPLAGRPLRPAAPRTSRPKLDSTRRVTLAGPMLTPPLVSFKDRELSLIRREAQRARHFAIPAWFLRLMIVAVVVLLGVRLTLSMLPQKPAASASAAVTPAAPAPEASVVNPLSRSIEVTGFRIVTDPSKKPEIHYLVVNHTPVRVSNMTVYVTLRTADDKPGQPPLSRFSFAAPNLGPFQSKEMISSIEKMNRPVALPEWQDLRADIEIGQ